MANTELSLSALARAGFDDLTLARGRLSELVAELHFAPNHLEAISLAADPDGAVAQLLILAHQDSELLQSIVQDERSLERLYTLFGASLGLADFFIRNQSELALFLEEPALPEQEKVNAEFARAISVFNALDDNRKSEAQAISALRVVYRRNLAKIALWDTMHEHPEEIIQDVTASLSALAAAALQAGLDLARLQSTVPAAELPKLAIIGMGKAGANELNYISDVDIIFVTEDRSEDSAEETIPRANWLAKRMMANLVDPNFEPMLWEIDTNLRPEGKSGALVRTLESHLAYYDRWAESWEFQALLKARTMAGDLDLGRRYEEQISVRVWNSASRKNFVESVQKMRERVTDNIPADELDRQIKLGPGGIRDIEFTVQLLQLVHGVVDDQIRQAGTLPALEALTEFTYIGREEAAEFASYYRILRLLEHRLQLRRMKRTHLLPTSDSELRILARASKLAKNAAEIQALWETAKKEVRSLHEKLFYRPLLTAVASLERNDFALSSEQASARLEAIGFRDPNGALNHIAAMVSGVTRSAQIQKNLLPVMLQWLAEGVEPDYGLLCLRRLSDELGTTHWYLRMLRDSSGAAYRLTKLLSNSRFIGELLGTIPEATAWLEGNEYLQPRSLQSLRDEATTLLDPEEDIGDSAKRLLQMRRREVLRASMAWALGAFSIVELGKSLSDITSALISALLERLIALRAPGLEFAMIAMGRFGGEELGLASDADVIMVYRELDDSSLENVDVQRLAVSLVTELKQLTTDHILPFQLDYDLRPEGKKGPLIRSFAAYQSYYERYAEVWEFQALLRARAIAGSAQLQTDFIALIDEYRYPVEVLPAQLVEIRRIKARVEAERLPRGADPLRHLKLGRGSLSDIEWLVQLYQFRLSQSHSGLKTPS
ncbi:MAG: bifunctional [glutamine synthetase] adenylyltransferase/[glutamine synthetase]-adenylyl-L-tyrosine phosphorylase, partial [Microbacteriaceae bacterium]